jgi:spore coat polysaccharide biosynthesis predicted glycosyltransferase SpsG
VARCAALARELGEPVVLFADPAESAPCHWASHMTAERSAADATEAIAALRRGVIGALIIDSFVVSESAIEEAAKAGFTAVFRDGRPYGHEAVAINPTPRGEMVANALVGAHFMPLPEGFCRKHEQAAAAAQTGKAPDAILVAFGLRDSADRTSMVLEGLGLCEKRPAVSVVVAETAQHRDAVIARASSLAGVSVVRAPSDMGGLYRDFDLAFGAPGVSQFERACCGLPTVLVAQNPGQEQLAADWAHEGAAVHCEASPEAVARAFASLAQDSGGLSRIRQRGLSMVDGRGASRLADELKKRATR